MNTADAFFDVLKVAQDEGRWSLVICTMDNPPVRGITNTTARLITIYPKGHDEGEDMASSLFHEWIHAGLMLNIERMNEKEELRVRTLERLMWPNLSDRRKRTLRGFLRRAPRERSDPKVNRDLAASLEHGSVRLHVQRNKRDRGQPQAGPPAAGTADRGADKRDEE